MLRLIRRLKLIKSWFNVVVSIWSIPIGKRYLQHRHFVCLAAHVHLQKRSRGRRWMAKKVRVGVRSSPSWTGLGWPRPWTWYQLWMGRCSSVQRHRYEVSFFARVFIAYFQRFPDFYEVHASSRICYSQGISAWAWASRQPAFLAYWCPWSGKRPSGARLTSCSFDWWPSIASWTRTS